MDAVVKGAAARYDMDWRRTAQLGAWMLSSWSGKRVKAEDLYRPQSERPRQNRAPSPERFQMLAEKWGKLPS